MRHAEIENKKLMNKIFLIYTQLESSTSNIVDQSFPRRLVGQPRRAYSRTALKFIFFSSTKIKTKIRE